jgi:phosphoglycolate phosphatase
LTKFKAVIFDLDGTLIDSSEGVVDAVNFSLRQVSAPEQPPEKIKRFIGFPLWQMYPHFTDQPYERMHDLFRERARETMVLGTVALDDAGAVLEELRSLGLRLGIATTKIREHVHGIVHHLGWAELIDALVGGDEVPKEKPDPAAFRLALERMSVTAGEALVVGDTINDVIAAQAVPMQVAAVNSPYGGREELEASAPDYFLESVAEVVPLVKNTAT